MSIFLKLISLSSLILDFRKLRKALSRRPLEGCQLGLRKVPYSRSVQVSNIGSISEDSLSAYFESRRSGGGGNVAVVMHNDKDCAIVTFESNEGMTKMSNFQSAQFFFFFCK